MTERMLRFPAVEKALGLCRSTLYAQIDRGVLPPPIRLSLRSAGWPVEEIDQVICARRRGDSEEQIRALVAEILEARRKVA